MSKGPVQEIRITGNFSIKERSPLIIIFIIALLVSILLSHPQFFVNDEWITANQLAQLEQGHQIVVAEDKYGHYQNGTPYVYFQGRNNLLGYPLFLPIISLPALKIIRLCGDTFDYWLMTIWSLLLIVLGLIIKKFYTDKLMYKKFSLSSLLIILAFLIFILNMIWYSPFSISSSDAPREAAAIILTNDLLFAGLCGVIFMTMSTLFQDHRFVWFGTFVCITSSSYLVWISSAKDHILTIFLFSLVIYGLVSFFYYKNYWWCFFSFFILGFLTWDRPEIGIFLLFFLFISLVPYVIRQWNITKQKQIIGYLLISPFFTAIGAIPLFINNYIITKNPLISPYSVWSQPGLTDVTSVSNASLNITGNLGSLFSTIFLWISPHFDTLLGDLIRILFLPETGSIGVFILVPVFLVGLFSIPLQIAYKSGRFTKDELYLMLSLGLLTIALFVSYLSQFPTLNADRGIAPDVRNLAPVYLTLNIMGLIILSKFSYVAQRIWEVFNYTAVFLCLLIPVFIGISSIHKQKVDEFTPLFFPIFSRVSFWISVMVIIVVIIAAIALWLHLKKHLKVTPILALIGLLIALPLVWQSLTIFLIANLVQAYEGYTFWLPVVHQIIGTLYAYM